MSKALSFYKEEISKKSEEIKSLNNIINIISTIRLVIVLLTIGSSYYFYKKEHNLLFLYQLSL